MQKNQIQNKQNSVTSIKVVVCTLWKLWKWMMKSYMFLMMSWKSQVTVSESELNERETFTCNYGDKLTF
jgi:hypothetical protein